MAATRSRRANVGNESVCREDTIISITSNNEEDEVVTEDEMTIECITANTPLIVENCGNSFHGITDTHDNNKNSDNNNTNDEQQEEIGFKLEFERMCDGFTAFKEHVATCFANIAIEVNKKKNTSSGDKNVNDSKIESMKEKISNLKKEICELKEERLNQIKIIDKLITGNGQPDVLSNNNSNSSINGNPSKSSKKKSKGKKKKDSENENTQVNVNKNNSSSVATSSSLPPPIVNEAIYNSPPPVIPGLRTFSSTVKYGKKVLVLGDSHFRNVKQRLFNDSITDAQAQIHWNSGIKVDRMTRYTEILLDEEKPDIVVVHVRTNDVNFTSTSNDMKILANKIINIGELCKRNSVKKVFISQILPRRNIKMTKLIRQANDYIEEACHANNFICIKNDNNIKRDFLSGDGKHLNEKGISVFAGNIVDCLNYYNHICKINPSN